MNNNLLKVTSSAGLNQIRGTNRAGATGSGIPKHVTAVSSSTANASTGLTSTCTVLFQRDPSDVNFGGVTVWIKGYQGNQTPTQAAQGADSPINFILNNTGEALSVIVQATGNGGSAPLSTAPTTGLSLPKSVSGGAGTTTVTTAPAKNIAVTVPSELSITGSPISTGTGGTFAIGKSTQSANTVWAGPSSGAAAAPTFRNLVQADLNVAQWSETGARYNGNGTALATAVNVWGGPTIGSSGTFAQARVGQTANDAPLIQVGMSNTASTSCGGFALDTNSINSGIVRGILRRASVRLRQDQTTNARYWIGMTASNNGPGSTAMASDTPNGAVAAFRYSSTTDTHYQAVLATSNVAITTVDTGITPTTSQTRLFEITYDGTNWNFYIDTALVASFNTNTPANNTLINLVNTVDNKNTANAATLSFSWMRLTYF